MVECGLCKSKKTYFKYKVGKFNYFYCFNCDMLFLYPRINNEKNNLYYSEHFEFTAGKQNEKRTRIQAKKTIYLLKKLYKEGETLLDIGSGYGFFLEEAQKEKLSSIGLEPAKKNLKIKSNNIISETFDSYYAKNKNKKFDFVALVHVIEHLSNPKNTLLRAFSMLNKNGVLYIETPNLNSHLYFQEKHKYTFLTPPDHQWIFSEKSFIKLLDNIKSCKILTSSTYSYPEHFVKIIRSILKRNNTDSQVQIDKTYPTTKPNNTKALKYYLFDRTIAPLLTCTLNLNNNGTFLQIYVKKI